MVPGNVIQETALHFTLGLPEEEILTRLVNTEKVVLVALYTRAVRAHGRPEEQIDKDVQTFGSKRVSKRRLVGEVAQLVTSSDYSPPPSTESLISWMDWRSTISYHQARSPPLRLPLYYARTLSR